jgi:hypothetical protein
MMTQVLHESPLVALQTNKQDVAACAMCMRALGDVKLQVRPHWLLCPFIFSWKTNQLPPPFFCPEKIYPLIASIELNAANEICGVLL